MSSRVSVLVRRLVAVLVAAMAVGVVCVSSASAAYTNVGSFSGLGTDPGLLTAPKRAAVDQDTGNLFVVDQGNDRVQVYGPDGNSASYLTSFGSGVVDEPFGIAIDQAADAVYVSDAGAANAVRKWTFDDDPVPAFAVDGGFTSPTLGTDPDQLEGFAAPLAVAPDGDLWVADPVANEIKRFASSGAHVAGSNFDGSTSPGGVFTGLLDVAVDSTGDLLVVDATASFADLVNQLATSRVERFAPDGGHEATVGSTNRPGAVAVDPDGDRVVVAADTDSYSTSALPSLHVFESDGTAVADMSINAQWAYTSGLAAVGNGSTRVYAITGEPFNDTFGPTGGWVFADPAPPTATIAPATDVTATTATLHGGVNPEDVDIEASYRFEYRKQGATAWQATPTANAGSATTNVDVEADIANLEANATYELRLIAENPGGTDTTAVETLDTLTAPPTVEALPASQITANDAWLKANINPNNQTTTYYFEYGTTTNYSNRIPLAGNAAAGDNGTPLEVTKAIHDLQPNTTYHYRVVATNPTGTTTGADRPLTTTSTGDTCPNADIRAQQQAQALPDCRAWEQVSPVEKHGYGVGQNLRPGSLNLGVSSGGREVTYDSTFPLMGEESGGWSGFAGQRAPDGWLTTSLLKFHGPNATGTGAPASTDTLLRGSTPDQQTSVYWDCTSEPYGALWIRRSDGTRQKIADATQPLTSQGACQGRGPGQPWFLGISPDGRHVVFNSTSRLGPAAGLPGTNRILYEWVDDGSNTGAGTLRVVNRNNDPALALVSNDPASLGGGFPLAGDGVTAEAQGMRNAISDSSDGHSRIFFQTPAPVDIFSGGGALYARIDGAATIELSAPESGHVPVSPPTESGIKYIDAAADGTRVFFFADGDLTAGAPPTGGIYRYDIDPDGDGPAAAALTWLADAVDAGAVSGIADADGSHLYFQGGDGVRLLSDSGNQLVYRGVLGAGSSNSNGTFTFTLGFRTVQCVSANVTADGRYLAFVARDASFDLRVYRFDSDANGGAGQLAEVSTGPEAPASYDAGFSGFCDGGKGRPVEKRVMSDDGQTIFFDAAASLVPGDSNGKLDAYRWRDGEVALVSKGTGPADSSFVGTDSTGSNAFFVTQDPLALGDGDVLYDLYDAKVDGGFAVAPSSGCDGDSCQGGQAGRPGLAGPGSSGLRGSGNAQSGARAVFSVARLSKAQLSALARRGSATLVVRVSRAGRVTVTGRARIRGRVRTVASASKRATRAGKVKLALRLSKTARRKLSGGGRLKVSLATRFAGAGGPRMLSLSLRRSK